LACAHIAVLIAANYAFGFGEINPVDRRQRSWRWRGLPCHLATGKQPRGSWPLSTGGSTSDA